MSIEIEKISPPQIRRFRQKVLSYYAKSARDLPWRKTTDPYSILVSEIMLQQTQVDRVIPFYRAFLERWPTIQDLAQANLSEVLESWSGLGYNRRARMLRDAAIIIVSHFDGDVIKAMQAFGDIPGIGPYTANAVRIFSTNEDIATVDTNIRRTLIHEFGLDEKTPQKDLWNLAARCIPKGKSRLWHNAMMDFGSTVQTSLKTGIRPVNKQSRFEGSDRQLRGKALRHMVTSEQLTSTFKDIADATGEITTSSRLQNVLSGLKKDGLIREKCGIYSLAH
ncbi:MAG: Fe-S cluster assembly protein HesB [archaeon]